MYNKRIAIIDLYQKSISTEPLSDEIIREYTGGALINLMLYKMHSHDDPVVIGCGPLTGTLFPGSSAIVITAKSRLTKMIAHVPLTWHTGSEMKFSGFDFVVVKGKSEKPVYLWFHDEIAEIMDGSALREMSAFQRVDFIRKELGDENIQLIATGDSAQKGFPFAALSENYWGSKDTSGFGTILGEKNIIACAFRGLGTFPMEQHVLDEFVEIRKKYDGSASPEPNVLKLMKSAGAHSDLISLVQKHLHRNNSCFNCGFNCYGYVKFREDAGIMKATNLEKPGTTIASPVSLSILYTKCQDNFFEIYEEAQLWGIEPGVASLMWENEKINNGDFKKMMGRKLENINEVNSMLLERLKSINPLYHAIHNTGIFPFALAVKDNIDINQWNKKVAAGLIAGICPVFLFYRNELNLETIEKAIQNVTGFAEIKLLEKVNLLLEKKS